MNIKIYCSGSIHKGSGDSKKLAWTDVERGQVQSGASPGYITFLNPDDPSPDLSDTMANFGRDLYQVHLADAVVVDGRERRGIGIGIEIMASRIFRTLLVVVVPRNTYYRMDSVTYRGSNVRDYVHPHLRSLADVIVETFEEAGRWIYENAKTKQVEPKGIDVVDEAMSVYKERLLPHDKPMRDLAEDRQSNHNFNLDGS